MLLLPLIALCAISAASSLVEAAATLPFQGKMRGVNLGGLFVLEPWMAMENWKNILKCDDVQESEWACMKKYTDAGQREQGDAAFKQHWENWITEQDIIDIRNMGLNTVRIPLGYWIVEELVQEGEYFPRGGHAQLTKVLQWCTTHGIAAMLVLHAAPGVQAVDQSFAGRQTASPEFYKPENYERAYKWAANITTSAYTIPGWESVFAIEAVNEPLQQWQSDALPIPGLVDTYYPKFLKTVRDTEAAQGVTCSSGGSRQRSKRATATHCLVVTYQDKSWGSYDPTTNLPSLEQTMYDGHAYLKWNPSVELSRSGYLSFAKEQNLAASSPSNDPLFIGEWSLSPSDSAPQDFDPNSDGAKQFYKDFWTAQAASADKGIGYTFWSYKTQTGDFRWDWSLAVKEGIIPSNVGGSPVTSAWRKNTGAGSGGGDGFPNTQPSQQPSPTQTPSSELRTGISRQSLTRPVPTFNSGSQIYNGALVASQDIDGKVVVKQTACPPSTRHRRRNAQLGVRRHHAAGQRMSK